jgi:acyl-coenzyme A synthetase/AMP-(fatty) acid ligase
MSAVIQPAQRCTPLVNGADGAAIAFDDAGVITRGRFLAQVRGLAALLPPGRHAVNLCEDRYRFLVAFCAVALRGQVTLLPPSRAPAVVADALARHAGSYCLGDGVPDPMPEHYWRLPEVLLEHPGEAPRLDDDALVAIGFTSGSTGVPKANPKTWGSLRTSTAQNLGALRHLWPRGADAAPLVATVPPQHMYGMELSVLLPLLGDVAVHCGRPFFPEDIARACRAACAPPLLVTTPVHLRALLDAGVAMPPLAGIVSATAPLCAELAVAAEARLGCEVREMFGSTETCVIAHRRTACEQWWTPMPGVRLLPQPDGSLVHARHLAAPMPLADLVELDGDGRFRVCGRQADLLEIAGKRASLADLTRALTAIPGVRDGVMLQLDACERGVARIAALAVAPGLDEETVLQALRRGLDPVFLPRPLRLVDTLPRNETGKLPRAALLRLLQCETAAY